MKWFLFLLISIPIKVLSLILAPLLPLFATKEGHLPRWLCWFDTPDNTIDGDAGFIKTHPISCYWSRVIWLFRNSAYGFSYSILGAQLTEVPKVQNGNIWVGNQPAVSICRKTGLSGDVLITSGEYWEKYHVSQWGSSNKCNRYRIGWKLSAYVQDPKDYPLSKKAQFVISWNPLMHFETGV